MSTHLRGPLLYGRAGHPFDGLPLGIVDQIGPEGVSGLYYEFYHFGGVSFDTLSDGAYGAWEISESNSGAVSIADIDATSPKGVLRLQCDVNAGDFVAVQALSQAFRYVAGKKLWFAIRCRLEDFDQDAMIAGLALHTANLDFIGTLPTDGIFFHKAGTDTDLDVEVRKDGTSSDHTNRAGTLVNDQWMVLGFVVNRTGSIQTFHAQNDAALALNATALTLTNVPDDENLTITFGIETADGGGDYMDVDWVLAAQEI